MLPDRLIKKFIYPVKYKCCVWFFYFADGLIQTIIAYDRDEGSRNPMPCTITGCHINFTVFFLEPIQVPAYDLLRLVKNKEVFNMLGYKPILRQQGMLYMFGVF